MKYTVFVTPEAEANINEAYGYIAQRSPANAVKWLRGLYDQIDSLERFPRRCGEAREQAYFVEELRQLVYKSHRIIFTIEDTTREVRVVYVRHAKRRAAGEPDDEDT